MRAKEYLQRVRILNKEIDQLISERYALKRTMDGLGAVKYDGVGGKAASTEAAFARLVEKIDAMEETINQKIDVYVSERAAIIEKIHALNDSRYIQLLYKRYVEFKPLFKVAVEMNYSEQHIRRLHGQALGEFERRWLYEVSLCSE